VKVAVGGNHTMVGVDVAVAVGVGKVGVGSNEVDGMQAEKSRVRMSTNKPLASLENLSMLFSLEKWGI
jgi:hypothetical protein